MIYSSQSQERITYLTLLEDGVTLLECSRQPGTQRVVLEGRRVSDANLEVLDGQVITAPGGDTNMFHSLKISRIENKTKYIFRLRLFYAYKKAQGFERGS